MRQPHWAAPGLRHVLQATSLALPLICLMPSYTICSVKRSTAEVCKHAKCRVKRKRRT